MALTKVTQHSLGNSAVTTAKINLTAPLGFANSSANVIFMAANGNVGIGTSTPTAKLEIGGTNPEIRLGPVQTSSGAYMSYDTTNNWFTLNAVTQGVAYRNICFATDGGSVGIGTTNVNEKLQVNGNIYLNTYALISRYGTGSSTSANAGELCKFGTDTQVYHDGVTLSSAGQAVVRFCGSRAEIIRMRNNSGYAIYAEAGGITSASDYRIKENITEIPNAWDKVKQINPVEYNVKEDWDYERRHQRQAGFLAHELQLLLPSAVGGTKDEVDKDGNPVMQGVDYSKVTPLLAAALKQALYKIETLEAKVAALEGNA